MSLVSTGFLVFLLVGVIVYYLIPKKAQWAWLLILSYAYYLCSGYKTVVFILLTTIVTFTSGILLERTEDIPSGRSSVNVDILPFHQKP